MAPRSHNSTDSFYYSNYWSLSGSKCSQNAAFSSESSRVEVTFHALYLIVFVALIYYTSFRTFKKKAVPIHLWLLFATSLLFMIIAMILSIIMTTLTECAVLSISAGSHGLIPVDWLVSLAKYILFALILLPICRRLHHQAKATSTFILIAHSITLTVLGILLLCAVALETKLVDELYGTSWEWGIFDLQRHERGLRTTFYVFEVVAMLMAAGWMVLALLRAPHLRKGVCSAFLFPSSLIFGFGLDVANRNRPSASP
ncbi:hypothetical protein BO71DRAFT_395577 [Aspergillus ellipticus CBS 707.79]|uniref:Integral membrane protein n=1 Tax=Aspergillus ellipticus CBS 707.79 TaxID=1448320 RepID=A0A319F0T7_9EURO|nr:hypothetical protein BO71DRAFT_395577 [Aspergillus ellipticus CBS 707.79]